MNHDRLMEILDVVLQIPEGKVASYGQVALAAGWPGRARLVGKALRDLPDNSHVPWQRVLRADGRVAFPSGDDRHELQVELLRTEGVELRNGRVDLRRFGWREA
jgi:methylated-DNA-protein-cysteine methyltransferase related protein